MKIGIDCRMWNETGMGRYIRNIVDQLTKLDTQNDYVLFFKSDTISQVTLPANFKKVVADVYWHTFKEQFILPIIFLRENLDLLHIPTPNIPIFYPKRFVVTIHDLTVLRVNTGRATTLPYPLYLLKRIGFRINLLVAAWRSSKIFTVSNFVKKDISRSFLVPEDKIVITPNAVDQKFNPKPQKDVAIVLKRYNITKPYLFYVGNAHPHKNLENLVQAFEKLSAQLPDLQLVIGGKTTFFHERLQKEWANKPIAPKINFTGFIDDTDLPYLYSGAEAMVNPSLYEGFGLQILEAFACGTKVICSSTTSLPEVGADVAYYFDPRNVEHIARTILSALADNDPTRTQRGYDNAQKYSWEHSAQKILDVYTDFQR